MFKSADIQFLIKAKTELKARFFGERIVILCPFHKEKTPSFVIDHQKNFFHCISCSKRGNLEELYAELDGKKPKRVAEHKSSVDDTVAGHK